MIEAQGETMELGIKAIQAAAVNSFAAWLPGHEKAVTTGSGYECGQVAELVGKFCKSQGWEIPEGEWLRKYVDGLQPYPSVAS